jgi:hypothetical protein
LTKYAIEHGPSIDMADIELVETLPPFLIFRATVSEWEFLNPSCNAIVE